MDGRSCPFCVLAAPFSFFLFILTHPAATKRPIIYDTSQSAIRFSSQGNSIPDSRLLFPSPVDAPALAIGLSLHSNVCLKALSSLSHCTASDFSRRKPPNSQTRQRHGRIQTAHLDSQPQTTLGWPSRKRPLDVGDVSAILPALAPTFCTPLPAGRLNQSSPTCSFLFCGPHRLVHKPRQPPTCACHKRPRPIAVSPSTVVVGSFPCSVACRCLFPSRLASEEKPPGFERTTATSVDSIGISGSCFALSSPFPSLVSYRALDLCLVSCFVGRVASLLFTATLLI